MNNHLFDALIAVAAVGIVILGFILWRKIQKAYTGEGRDTFEDERLPADELKLAEHRLTNLNVMILKARANKKRHMHLLSSQAEAQAEVDRLRRLAA